MGSNNKTFKTRGKSLCLPYANEAKSWSQYGLSSGKPPPPISDHLVLTFLVAAYGRFDFNYKRPFATVDRMTKNFATFSYSFRTGKGMIFTGRMPFSDQFHARLRFSVDLNIAKLDWRFCIEARKLCPPQTFSITTKGSCWSITDGDWKSGKILERMENGRFINGKRKILWQFENLQNHLWGFVWKATGMWLGGRGQLSSVHKNSILRI